MSLAWTREDAVGVDVERDLDLRHAARRRHDPLEVEACRACGCSAPRCARPGARGPRPTAGCRSPSRRSPSSASGWWCCAGSSTVITPPSVSTPSESGVTSSRTMSLTSPESTPAWTAAPMATTSSGFTPLCGSLPKNFFTVSCTSGMRVEPPTRTTSSISLRLSSWRRRAPCCTGSIVRSTSGCDHLLELGAA